MESTGPNCGLRWSPRTPDIGDSSNRRFRIQKARGEAILDFRFGGRRLRLGILDWEMRKSVYGGRGEKGGARSLSVG